MPTYMFLCTACEYQFEELCGYNDRDEVRCCKCGKKPQQLLTSPRSVIFKEKKGTSREDNFEYTAAWNHEQNQNLRRAAERANKHGDPYNPIDDMAQYEGKIE